jgi:diguanylate cyclase (GGDEF)-like protein/PAS domain S-box-containing protein
MSCLCRWLAALLLLCFALPALAQEEIRIGVLAYRPKAQMQAQWEPLARAMNQAIPKYHFVVEIYDLEGLTSDIAARRVDLILTNPGHYILMARRSGLSAPLATLSTFEQGVPVSSFGGVIFARADRAGMDTLADLRGKTAAFASYDSLGSYQMQAYELHLAGLTMPGDVKPLPVGLPQDKVVSAVLEGQADVGFVRSSVLEGLAKENKLDLTQIKIINSQHLPGFPAEVSTRLYPEWPFAAMPHANKDMKRAVASFLLGIENDKALISTLKIHGFDVPADYSPVEDLLRDLRMPPYEKAPSFTLRDIWERYQAAIVIGVVSFVLLLLLGFWLLILNRRLHLGEAKLSTMLHTISDLIWLKSPDGAYLACNPMFERYLNKKEHEILGKTDFDFVSPEIADFYRRSDLNAIDRGGPLVVEEWITFADSGRQALLETTKTPMYNKAGKLIGVLGVGHDITERHDAEAKIERLNNLYAALSECNQAIVRCSNQDELFKVICADAVRFGKMKSAWIGLVDEAAGVIRPMAWDGHGQEYMPGIRIPLHGDDMALGPAGIAYRDDKPMWCQDYLNDPTTAPRHESADHYGWGSAAALPLHQDGKVVGVFVLYVSAVNGFDEPARNLLTEMAMDISFALNRFSSEVRRKASEEQLKLAAEVFRNSTEGFLISDADANIILVNEAFTRITGYTLDEALGQNPHFIASDKQSQNFYEVMWQDIRAQGFWRGEIWNRKKTGEIYPEWLSISRVQDTDGNTTHYIGIFSDITEKKNAEERIHWLAHFDELTGLPNRTLLTDRIVHAISQSQRSGEPMALMFLDLDHFKNINDSLGHHIGDRLLIQLGERLKTAVRNEDTVARLGGDEFIILISGTSVSGAAHVAQKILDTVSRPFSVDLYELTVTPSVGIAMYPNDGEDKDALFKSADAAMYQVKQSGRNGYRFFTQEMQTRTVRMLHLENALRHAIKNGELSVYYQPQISIATGEVSGAEALLRWQHPEFGWVSPAEFIPIAEETGQILAIGEWVMRQTLQRLKAWTEAGLPALTVAVNISAIQFRQHLLPQLIMQILNEAGLPPGQLELELTESVAMSEPQAAIAMMDKLHSFGIRMAIDDFGTGYSSLSLLKRFQVHKLKIDQSFVRDITVDAEDKAIVSAIISMAKSLGLKTIAEGVETVEQFAFLKDQGCDEVQGYYFSKPLNEQDFEEFLRKNRRD